MVKITWHKGQVPEGMKVKQVYGLLFTRDGRFLVRIENKPKGKFYTLAGGTPENFDKNFEATLRRELVEEVNTTIKNPILVGYQKIDMQDGSAPFAQLRMVAVIDKIGEKLPDPDNGETYDRLLTPYKKAIDLIGWGDVLKDQVEEAAKIAHEQLGVEFLNDQDEYI